MAPHAAAAATHRQLGPAQALVTSAPNIDCGYPSSVETKSGKIVTIYYQVDDAQNAPASAKAKVIQWEVPKK